MRRAQWLKVAFLAVFWTFSTVFISLFEGALLGFPESIGGVPYRFRHFFVLAVGLSAVLSTAAAFFEVFCFSRLLRKSAFGLSLLIKAIFYLFMIALFHTATALLLYRHNLHRPIFDDLALTLFFWQHIRGLRLFVAMAYYGIVVVLALFILQVSQKLGQGVLFNFITGRYHRPKQVRRIFMFMDLKFSTAYAERLGHIRYSQLIQECFFDLSDIVARYDARIYQYVGDAVVLTWEVDQGLARLNCLWTYFAYDAKIRARGAVYAKKFGMVPEFKASLHMGEVTLAEVGELKKELAFHGDVIITAARIQEKCNEYNAKLLVSERLKKSAGSTDLFRFEGVGDILLKGKHKSVALYKVTAKFCPL